MKLNRAWCGAVLQVFALVAGAVLVGCVPFDQRTVRFSGPPFPLTEFAVERARRQGQVLQPKPSDEVVGYLSRPDGPGPFPAVVLLHGCSGRGKWNTLWAERLVSWGYVVLDVDSHVSRNVKRADVCGGGHSPGPVTRAHDAFGAKTVLESLDYVDPDRIAALGMSQGGGTVLRTVDRTVVAQLGLSPFRAAVALYPPCDGQVRAGAPLLLLIGEADNWTPAVNCRRLAEANGADGPMTYVEYPGAHHGFDIPFDVARWHNRYIVRHDASAEADAIGRVRQFLAGTMK